MIPDKFWNRDEVLAAINSLKESGLDHACIRGMLVGRAAGMMDNAAIGRIVDSVFGLTAAPKVEEPAPLRPPVAVTPTVDIQGPTAFTEKEQEQMIALAKANASLDYFDAVDRELEDILEFLETRGYSWDENDGFTTCDAESRPATEERSEVDDAMPALLPIAGMPGYAVDACGRPHAEKKRGRKAGPLMPDKFFRKDKTFVFGYRIRVGDRRKRYAAKYFGMARYFAEKKWENAG